MDLREIGLGGCGLDSTVSRQGPVAGCCECGDESSGSCATELVRYSHSIKNYGFKITFNGMTFLLIFIKIYQLFQKLTGG
jgi:hypothetical protein